MYLLDSSALLALVLEEPGGDRVESFFEKQVFMSSVNYAEALLKLKRYGKTLKATMHDIRSLHIRILDFTEITAEQTTRIHEPSTINLSLGDKACLATALELGLPVVTADRAWAKLDLPIKVIAIRS